MAKKVLVVLDPGHHKQYNKGAVAGYYEGDRMYDLSEYESTALKSYGIDTIFTRKRDGDMEVYNRGQVAVKNAKGYDIVVFISNHSDAFNGKACGVTAYRSTCLPESDDLGQKLINAIVDVMKPTTKITYSRGVKTRLWGKKDYFGVIRGSVSGASSIAQAEKGPVKYTYLVEHGFHDNATECEFLNDKNNLKKIAEAKAKAIADYFGLTKKTSSTKTETVKTENTSELYRVRKSWEDVKSQKGAFKNLASAKALADKNPGFSVYNSKGVKIYPIKKTLDELAREVLNGKWGNGNARKVKLTTAFKKGEIDYDYNTIQKRVNSLV